MKRLWAWVSIFAVVAGCSSKPAQGPAHRAELHKLTGNVVEIIPSEGQPEWCLVYTISNTAKIIRQQTMSRQNHSFNCPAGQPIGNSSFRIPVEEGPVKVYVFFSDQRLNAASMAQQLFELSSRPVFNVLDLRAPGRIVTERFDFIPEEEQLPETGMVVGAGVTEDGGAAAGPDSGAR